MVPGRRLHLLASIGLVSALVSALLGGCKSKKTDDDSTDRSATEADGALAAADDEADAAAAPPAPTRPERPVWRLGDNLLAAHLQVGGDLVVDAGSIGFSRYIRFNMPVARWHLLGDAAGRRVARTRRGASIELPLSRAQAAAARGLALALVADRPSRLSVKIGGRRAGRIDVAPGRAWYTVDTADPAAADPAAADRWVAGENQIVLEGAPVALEAVRVYADRAAVDADPEPIGHATWDTDARQLSLDRDAGLVWYVDLPPLAHLVAHVPDSACRVEVSAETDTGVRAAGVLGGDVGAVDLGPAAGLPVRLELTARDCPRATLDDPAITVPGAELPAPPAGPPPRYVVLWVMDALRADRLRPFEPGARPEVPNFEKLARTGAVFRSFYVVGNESQTSHATMWTGTYPAVHNVRMAGVGGTWRIPRALPVLGELVAAAGLTPVGVTGNGFITEHGGYARGFAEFRNMMREKGVINGVLYGAKVVKTALARLEALRADPVLLFLGTVDTHGPWIARKPWIDRYDPGPYHGPFQEYGTMAELGIVRGKMGCSKIPPPRDIQRLRAIYDSAVSYHDERLGELIAALQRMGIYEQTMIVITADHGEELFEDRRCGHGGSLRETLVRVPLLIHYPARVAPGAVEEGVDGVDVLPTLLDALDADRPAHLQGASLLPLAAGVGRGWPRPSYASQFEYAHAMRIGRWKMKVGKRGIAVVVDLVEDPDERVDRSPDWPFARRFLTDALGLFLANRARWHKPTMGVVTNLKPGAAAALEAPP